ncbi:hypothetical protein SNEBB_000148 [Seison nebaliae]|nr:hypothetical protein SNEBB_000148 [Seison nebaliae]
MKEEKHIALVTHLRERHENILFFSNELKLNHSIRSMSQRLPRSMRRRATSHTLKRLPSCLRGKAENERKKGVIERKKIKKNNRRYRRRNFFRFDSFYNKCLELCSRNVTALRKKKKNGGKKKMEVERNKNTNWLSTHVWHAKRFHMSYGKFYRQLFSNYQITIPLYSNDRCRRWKSEPFRMRNFGCLNKYINQNCLLYDVSYYASFDFFPNDNSLQLQLDFFKTLLQYVNGNDLRIILQNLSSPYPSLHRFMIFHDKEKKKILAPIDIQFHWEIKVLRFDGEFHFSPFTIWIHPTCSKEFTRFIYRIFYGSSPNNFPSLIRSIDEMRNYSKKSTIKWILVRQESNRKKYFCRFLLIGEKAVNLMNQIHVNLSTKFQDGANLNVLHILHPLLLKELKWTNERIIDFNTDDSSSLPSDNVEKEKKDEEMVENVQIPSDGIPTDRSFILWMQKKLRREYENYLEDRMKKSEENKLIVTSQDKFKFFRKFSNQFNIPSTPLFYSISDHPEHGPPLINIFIHSPLAIHFWHCLVNWGCRPIGHFEFSQFLTINFRWHIFPIVSSTSFKIFQQKYYELLRRFHQSKESNGKYLRKKSLLYSDESPYKTVHNWISTQFEEEEKYLSLDQSPVLDRINEMIYFTGQKRIDAYSALNSNFDFDWNQIVKIKMEGNHLMKEGSIILFNNDNSPGGFIESTNFSIRLGTKVAICYVHLRCLLRIVELDNEISFISFDRQICKGKLNMVFNRNEYMLF